MTSTTKNTTTKSTTTKDTTTKNTTSAGTAVRPVQRGHQVAVQFSARGVQRVDARAHASGGRGDQPVHRRHGRGLPDLPL